jgi:ABC-2 type transport system permease protein
MGLWEILWGKFLGGVVPIAVVGVVLVWISNAFLGVDPFVTRLSNVTVCVMAITLSGMGVGFGALFPRFNLENVAQIQTSPGGILFMIAALLRGRHVGA